MVVVGLPARLLAPGHWPELLESLGGGLAGIEDAELPYDGRDVWLRLTLLLLAAGGGVMAWLSVRQIGGQTGDVLGAFEQVAEILILLSAAALT